MERPKRNRLYDGGYTWQGTLFFAGVLFGVGVLIVVIMLALGFHRPWFAALMFGGLGIAWSVRAWLLYRHTKRAEESAVQAANEDDFP
ncbi:hypothetical protein GCM10010988_38760 [Cnuibacter physcomitrellae]|nr:hypothetical protein [Cnuibacter physcomitrellae]GGI42384.1 hypothetical protein GCM10010988_38760 [Cnuibacter physcomitrellae]